MASGVHGQLRIELWILAVLVWAWIAVHHEQDKENKATQNRDEADEQQPAAHTNIVEPANTARQRGYESGEAINRDCEAEKNTQYGAFCRRKGSEGDDLQGAHDDYVEQGKHPILFAARPAIEVRIPTPYQKVPIHGILQFLSSIPDSYVRAHTRNTGLTLNVEVQALIFRMGQGYTQVACAWKLLLLLLMREASLSVRKDQNDSGA
jgi:hypothetical protein